MERGKRCAQGHSSLDEGWDGSPVSLSGTHTSTFSIITLLSAVHPSVAAFGVGLDPTVLRSTGQGPGYQVFKRRAGQGWALASQAIGQQMETGQVPGNFFPGWSGGDGVVLKTVPLSSVKGEPSG